MENITAKQAKEIAKRQNSIKSELEISDLNKEIGQAAEIGKYKINYYKPLCDTSIAYLHTNGFKLKPVPDQKDGDFIIISWK